MLIYLVSETTYHDGGQHIIFVSRHKKEAMEQVELSIKNHILWADDYPFFHYSDSIEYYNLHNGEVKHLIKFKPLHWKNEKQIAKFEIWKTDSEAVELIEVHV